MGAKLPPAEMELYRRTDEILHYLWDPICVACSPPARDEYSSYLPRVFGLLRDRAEPQAIVDYLVSVERDRMGLAGNPEKAKQVADVLIEYRTWIADHRASNAEPGFEDSDR